LGKCPKYLGIGERKSQVLEVVLAQISAINVELLARRELD